ncbi:MAG TPA: hypothetical protein VFK38_07625, partial [Candidatus Limnocylindrales bacterium]|nr:hypothetical protein [Candidatus Limnocylindrales bacterium]
ISNLAARALDERFGFRPVGVRPRYYSDNAEDALIMTTDALGSTEMAARLDRLRPRYAEPALDDRALAEPDDAGPVS